jgi:uncharacterized protein (TIGR02266 family)
MSDEFDELQEQIGISKGDFGDTRFTERRVEERSPASLKVSYKTYSEFIENYTNNVSRRGMFIGTRHRHKAQERVDLFLHVPGLDDPIRIIGEIAHITTDDVKDEDAGVGVRFVDIDDKSRQILIDFIKSQEPGI